MKTHFHHFAAAALAVAGAGLASSSALAAPPVRVCTFAGSPSAALDTVVAKRAFAAAGVAATLVENGIGGGDDDGVSLKELRRTLGRGCDVIAGFPRSSAADGSGSEMRFSRGYLRADYVSVRASGRANGQAADAPDTVIAATYGSPSQLIAVQEQHVHFVLENTPELTVYAVAAGRAARAIVWYPAVVAYQQAHGVQSFDVRRTRSPYSTWELVFAFDSKAAALQRSVDVALDAMTADGRLAKLTHAWTLPESTAFTDAGLTRPATFAYLDGPVAPAGAMVPRAMRVARYAPRNAGRIVKVSSEAGDTAAQAPSAPSFDRAQVAHGKTLYGSACAKCHGANLQGNTAPALSGPAFAPASGSHLTIGGIFTYMSTNMPADRPGKLKDAEYADIMAYLLNANGYAAGTVKMTADAARGSTTMLNAGPGAANAGSPTPTATSTSTASAK